MNHTFAVNLDASDSAVTAVACFGATFDCILVDPEVCHESRYFASSAFLAFDISDQQHIVDWPLICLCDIDPLILPESRYQLQLVD